MTQSELTTSELIDQRLDALDQALLGLASRSERLAIVAGIEKRLRERLESDSASVESAVAPSSMRPSLLSSSFPEVVNPASAAVMRSPSGPPRKRSHLALWGGILGIVAVSLLSMLPVTKVVVSAFAERMGEGPSLAILGANVVIVAGLGVLSLLMSLVAMTTVSRTNQGKCGLAWAITGLSTSPLAALVGVLAVVYFVIPAAMDYSQRASPISRPATVPSMIELPEADAPADVESREEAALLLMPCDGGLRIV